MNYSQRKFMDMVRSASEETLMMSYKDCHLSGVDSIVVKNDNGILTRAYILHEHHDMYLEDNANPFSCKLGIHNHKYDLELRSLLGSAYNLIYSLDDGGVRIECETVTSLTLYEHTSTPNDNSKFKVSNKGKVSVVADGGSRITHNRPLYINKDQLHTVAAHKGRKAAWLVQECVSTTDTSILLTNASEEGLTHGGNYKRFSSKQEIITMLEDYFK